MGNWSVARRAAECIHGLLSGRPPQIDLDLEKAVQAFLRQAIGAGLVASAHDLADGGLAVGLAEACIASGLGASVAVPAGATRLDRLLFAEGGARILVSVGPDQAEAWQQALDQAAAAGSAILAQRLGQVQASADLLISQADQALVQLPITALKESFEQAIPRRIGAGV